MWGWVGWGCILFFHFDLLQPKTRKATAQQSFRRLYHMRENTSAWCNLHVASGFAAIMWLSGKTHIFPSAAREQVETFHQLPAAVNIFGKHFKCVQVALDVSFAFLSGAAGCHELVCTHYKCVRTKSNTSQQRLVRTTRMTKKEKWLPVFLWKTIFSSVLLHLYVK